MLGKDVDLFERVPVDQARDPLASGQLAFGVLPVERFGVAVPRVVLAPPELVERIDLLGPRRGPHQRSMNIQRWPSRSSALYRLPGPPDSTSERIVAPAALARPKCAVTSST